jgi:hypothetical protein
MTTLQNINKEGRDQIIEQAIDYLKNNPSCYGCDLHNEIFNSDYFIIGTWQAEQWLVKNYSVFGAIGAIQEYETDNFGEVNTDLSQAEKVVNMLVYIAGEELLSESEHLRKVWDNHLTPKDCKKIIKELESIF